MFILARFEESLPLPPLSEERGPPEILLDLFRFRGIGYFPAYMEFIVRQDLLKS